MLFNSLQFLIFFPLVAALYFVTPRRFQWCLLLVASCYFYMAFVPAYILVLFALILIDYFAAILIDAREGRARTVCLWISIFANVALLAAFKYFNFFNDNVTQLLAAFDLRNPVFNTSWVLPIGLSFHTFQSLAYTIEVYRGRFKPERHLGIYAVYVLYFPQMVAGPIERPQHLLPQLRVPHFFNYDNAVAGLRLMLLGFTKKLLIADHLAAVISPVYGNVDGAATWALVLATYLFGIQVYCDFSGYTDIARGAARFLGMDLALNFNRPYFARSMADFWQRWHISLSSWFRDYLFTPLAIRWSGGKRSIIMMISLLTMLVSGLWHGANWTYVIWGGLHGLYLVAEQARKIVWPMRSGKMSPGRSVVEWFIVFQCVSFSWVFFRSPTLKDAWRICQRIFAEPWTRQGRSFETSKLAYLALVIGGLFVFEWLCETGYLSKTSFDRMPRPLRWAVYYGVILMIVGLGKFAGDEFIYFQF